MYVVLTMNSTPEYRNPSDCRGKAAQNRTQAGNETTGERSQYRIPYRWPKIPTNGPKRNV
ncbi:hypothetical protein CEXT_722501, partial [Caerostris extrusa]